MADWFWSTLALTIFGPVLLQDELVFEFILQTTLLSTHYFGIILLSFAELYWRHDSGTIDPTVKSTKAKTNSYLLKNNPSEFCPCLFVRWSL